jgi:nitroreductase
MDAMEAILGRRSIRAYADKPVSDEAIETLLRAAMSAPSANNKQPWHFIVIDDRETLDAIPTFHPYSKMIKKAPVAILVCGDTELASSIGYMHLDCSAATENLLIAAHAIGLGAVWLGIYPREGRIEGMRKLMNLPDHIHPLALISIGYPAEKKQPANRYNEARIRRNRWE